MLVIVWKNLGFDGEWYCLSACGFFLNLHAIDFVSDIKCVIIFAAFILNFILIISHEGRHVSLRYVVDTMDLLPHLGRRVQGISHLLLESSTSLKDAF
jgi:hypothetical protein